MHNTRTGSYGHSIMMDVISKLRLDGKGISLEIHRAGLDKAIIYGKNIMADHARRQKPAFDMVRPKVGNCFMIRYDAHSISAYAFDGGKMFNF